MFPVSTNRIDAVEILLGSTNASIVNVTARLRRAERLNDFSSTSDLAVAVVEIPPGKQSGARFEFNAAVEPGSLYWVSLEPTPGVCVLTSSRYLPGVCMKADGCYFGNSNFCFEVFPRQNVFCPGNVVNGISRASNLPNMWVSDPAEPMPQFVEIDFQKIVEFDKVEIIFDTNLNRLIKTGPAQECVRDYELLALIDETIQSLVKVEGNYQRRRVHETLNPVRAEKLRLAANAANGDPAARVYEIRVFKKHEERI